ncbi:uncharacterized protein LOC119990514 [Tripterygium wilfordii]|uniref:uncharacterized protein LOC119990514 n=1 Tax=Tripterygium wilfordii TaxID=458696 RepID=UPI0018F80236|nr:uncharacterized protein LOC119990514 [Tripterygium wilfordii]
MKQEAIHEVKLPLWVEHINAFFHLPNPRIFTLFTISSTVTFSLGLAMIVELVLHGEHHQGYGWIAYYAPLTITLPVSMWIICIISALFLPYKDQNMNAVLSLSDPSHGKPSSDQQPKREQQMQDQQPKDPASVTLERIFSLPISKTTTASDNNLERSRSCP